MFWPGKWLKIKSFFNISTSSFWAIFPLSPLFKPETLILSILKFVLSWKNRHIESTAKCCLLILYSLHKTVELVSWSKYLQPSNTTNEKNLQRKCRRIPKSKLNLVIAWFDDCNVQIWICANLTLVNPVLNLGNAKKTHSSYRWLWLLTILAWLRLTLAIHNKKTFGSIHDSWDQKHL